MWVSSYEVLDSVSVIIGLQTDVGRNLEGNKDNLEGNKEELTSLSAATDGDNIYFFQYKLFTTAVSELRFISTHFALYY